MHVRILLFAGYRQAAGAAELSIEVQEGDSIRVVAEQLERQFEGLDLSGALCAVNEAYASPDSPLSEGDTVALFPPVAGGTPAHHLVVTEDPLDIGALNELASAPELGAVATFVGTVRSPNHGKRVDYIDYQGYEAMMRSEMHKSAAQLHASYDIGRVVIAHRLGRLFPGDASIFIAVAAPHRRDALAACQACIERLKQRLPVWKYEKSEGESRWTPGATVPGAALERGK